MLLRKGELQLSLPIGLIRNPSGVVVQDPDLAVRERLGLVFDLFTKFRTVAKVMRILNDRGLDLPRRDQHGDPHGARATIRSVAAILKNPKIPLLLAPSSMVVPACANSHAKAFPELRHRDQSRSVAPAGGSGKSSLRHGLESPNAAMWAISQTFSFGQTGERCSGGDRPRTGRLRLGDLPIGSACCRMTYLIDLKPRRRNSVPVDRPKLGKAGGTVTARRTLENIYSRMSSDAGC